MGNTKIILKQDVPNLGEEGDVKSVKSGFARNYLFPKGFAIDYSLKNRNELERKRDQLEKKKLAKKENAKQLKEKLEEQNISIEVPAGDKGRLYGTVTTMQIDQEIKKLGFEFDRKKIELKEHIKFGGKYKFTVHLYGEVYANMELEVIPKQEEKKQEQKVFKKRKRYEDREDRIEENDSDKKSTNDTKEVTEE